MPSVPSPSSPNASESAGNIIDIPADKATLRLFVTLLESGPLAPFTSPCTPVYIGTMVKRLSEFKHHPERCGLKRLNAITDILKRFDCSSALLERALFHLRPTFGEAPWRFFEVAANSSDIQNAKDAIRRFPAAPQFTTLEPEMMGAKTVRSIPLEYFLGYLRAVGAQKKAMNTVSLYLSYQWVELQLLS